MKNDLQSVRLYEQGNYASTYTEIPASNPGRAWRDGMVSANGENGYVTSGAPYSDSFIFQYMWFNYPSGDPRVIPEELPGQLAEARRNVFQLNDQWKITFADGTARARTFLYSYHPGHQLRLSVKNKGTVSGYERWTNYETAETGVSYSDEDGGWVRTSFTSREDNVTITKISQSSAGAKINMIISIDDISGMYKAQDGATEVTALQYKKLVDPNADYIAQVAHYPSYPGSELTDGGYAGLTRVVVINGTRKRVLLADTDEPMNVGAEQNPAIQVTDAEAIYLITQSDRTFDMGKIGDFAGKTSYAIVDANVNLQVSPMNTGHLTLAQPGYITFFLRDTPDFEYNARMAYGMHDALQVSVNSDIDRGMHVEYDNDYPFQYWNAGASWCLLPIFEYWQCYGNQQIPINDHMRIHELKPILSVRDGGLMVGEFAELLGR